MLHRPLVFVSALTFGDYLLWNWSLNSNHDVLALVSGLTLPPLALACLWLLALTLAHAVAAITRRSLAHPSIVRIARRSLARDLAGRGRKHTTTAPQLGASVGSVAAAEQETSSAASTAGTPTGRLAA